MNYLLDIIKTFIFNIMKFLLTISLIKIVCSVRQYTDSEGFLVPPKKNSIFEVVEENRFS